MTTVGIGTGVALEHETFGSPDDPPLLLIGGLGAQLLAWRDGFCRALADGGRYVIRYDNRDCGLSTCFDEHPVDMGAVIAAAVTGDLDSVRAQVPYTLRHMAADAVGLLDALGIDRAHIVGSSLGGMVAQLVAIGFPERAHTLTSMMSSTGESDVGQSTAEASAALLAAPATSRAEHVARTVAAERVWGSRRYFDADDVAEAAGAAFDRSWTPAGTARQLAALLATGSLAEELRLVRAPTLVLHGLDDTLITPSGGQRTAELIAGAELLLVPDMGHDRPAPLWPVLCDAIVRHTAPDRTPPTSARM